MIGHMGAVALYLFSLFGDYLNTQNGLIKPSALKNKFMNFLKNNWFKIIAILFLLGALGDNAYGYYQVLRWVILIIGGYSAYSFYKLGNKSWPWIFGVIAILFNPIFLITFQRGTWQIIDVVVAIIFITSLFHKNERKN